MFKSGKGFWGSFFRSCACLAAGAELMAAAGCKVDATPAIQRTSDMITERTGAAETFRPDLDTAVEGKVQGLLDEGLTLEEAVQIAFLNNRDFQSLFYQIGSSQADVVQAMLLTNPSFGWVSRIPEGGGRSNFEMTLGQEIVDLWQIPVRKRIAKAALEQTELRVAQRAVDLQSEVKTRFFEAIAARRAEDTARESVRLVQEALRVVEQQLQAGEVSQFDVQLERNTVIEANLSAIDLRREVRVSDVELSRVLGLSQHMERIPLKGELPMPGSIPTDAELLKLAAEQRFDLRQSQEEFEQAQAELIEQRLKLFPSIVAGFDLERLERRALPNRTVLADTARESIAAGQLTAPAIQSRAQRRLEQRQIIDAILGPTVQITLPIWDQNQAQVAKAHYKLGERRKTYEALLDNAAAAVERAAAQVRNAQQLAEYYEQQALPQAQQNVESATRVYRQGEQSIVALVEAQRSLVTRRANYVTVLRSYAVALAELEAAVGGSLPETATQPAASQASAEKE